MSHSCSMGGAQTRADYQHGTCRVAGAAAEIAWSVGCFSQSGITRLARGDFRFTVSSTNQNEVCVDVSPISPVVAAFTYAVEWESLTSLRIRIQANGDPYDGDFYVELTRQRNILPGETTPTASPYPPPVVDQAVVDLQILTQAISYALSGTLEQVEPDPIEVSAADLNAAPAGTLAVTFEIEMISGITRALWSYIIPVLTPTENCADPQIGVPTVQGTPRYQAGLLQLTLVADTDEGATKVYAPGDEYGCDVQVSATDVVFGVTVAQIPVTVTVV